MNNPNHKLLFGPYKAPALSTGDRAVCLLRREVVVVGYSTGRIRWPLCRVPGKHSQWSLLVDAELARAIRQESAGAVVNWWGVSADTVTRWRRTLGVPRWNP